MKDIKAFEISQNLSIQIKKHKNISITQNNEDNKYKFIVPIKRLVSKECHKCKR